MSPLKYPHVVTSPTTCRAQKSSRFATRRESGGVVVVGSGAEVEVAIVLLLSDC